MVVVDDRGVGRLQRLGAEVPFGRPGQHVIRDAARFGHRSQAHVRGLGDDHVQQVPLQLRRAGDLPARVHQVVGEPGARVDLHQHRRDRDAGQQRAELVAQRLGLGRDVLGGQRRDDQLTVPGQPDLARTAAPGELGLQVRQGRMQLVARQGQGVGSRRGLADDVAELQPLRLPLLRGEQERGRVGVPARPRDVDISRSQAVAQGHQHAQLPVVPEGGDVACLPRILEVPGPPGQAQTRPALRPGPCGPSSRTARPGSRRPAAGRPCRGRPRTGRRPARPGRTGAGRPWRRPSAPGARDRGATARGGPPTPPASARGLYRRAIARQPWFSRARAADSRPDSAWSNSSSDSAPQLRQLIL